MSPKPLQGKRLSDITIKLSKNINVNARTLFMPIVAFTMASIVYVYARSSIYAAKKNAQRHREADGGQISWRNESQRRHGTLDTPAEGNLLRQLLGRGNDEKSTLRDESRRTSSRDDFLQARRSRNKEG